MNRCIRTLLAPAALLLTMGLAHAQDIIRQTIPGNAKLGVMQVTLPPEVLMDGKVDRLSPGARIRAENNMLVVSGALSGQTLLVAYVREPNGLLHEVWILNAAERAAILQRAASASSTSTTPASSGN
jgi:hypothetical protein